MPAIDLRTIGNETPASLAECDVCVVGTGPAGSTLAKELSGSGLRVTLLESGGFERTDEADRLNDVENVGRLRVADQWAVRNRIVGGSSHTWGGRCAAFDAIDFERRDWVPDSGWPISLAELEPYLDRSAGHLGLAVGGGFSDERFWPLAGREPPGRAPDPDLLLPFFWQFSRDPEESYPFEYMRFGRGLGNRLGPNVTLVTGATVLRVDPVPSGRAVRAVEFAGPDGKARTLAARNVALCAGGIENARILLSSDTLSPKGLGNEHDLVGRYLMDHLRGPVGAFAIRGSGPLQKRFGRYTVQKRLFRAGLRLSPKVQRDEGLLNCAAWLGEVVSPTDPWDALRRVMGGAARLPRDAVSILLGAGYFARGVKQYLTDRNGVPRKLEALNLDCMCEQTPNPDSRVTLSDLRDRFGVRLPRVDWRSHPDESRTMRRMAQLAAQELPRMGLPGLGLADWVRDEADFPESFQDVAHPTGTTKMSRTPATGVVDTDCRVHGVEGLYVTGSSVFPTAGHCNPTQMIVALSVRLADHLRLTARQAAREMAFG